jgi:hypothetical protein
MRTFIVGWLIAFCIVAFGAGGIGLMVARQPSPATTAGARPPTSVEDQSESSGPFAEADAVEVVARRFAPTRGGDLLREQLRDSPMVSYYSPAHWRVCVDSACWIAHGPGRYAEPENDAARLREVLAASNR